MKEKRIYMVLSMTFLIGILIIWNIKFEYDQEKIPVEDKVVSHLIKKTKAEIETIKSMSSDYE